MTPGAFNIRILLIGVFIALTGCSGEDGIVLPPSEPNNPIDLNVMDGDGEVLLGEDGEIYLVPNAGLLGEPCELSAECREGLICDLGFCTCPADKPVGSTCIVNCECKDGLVCGLPDSCQDGLSESNGSACTPVCIEQGEGEAGKECFSNTECTASNYCDFVSIVGTCAPVGNADRGMACKGTGDCAGGLVCVEETCTALTSLLSDLGASRKCDPDDQELGRVYFELAELDQASAEFYRLPFPNDLRKTGGKIDLEGHPKIGGHIYGFDPAERLIEAIEAGVEGFATTASIFFRFSRSVDLDGFVVGSDLEPDDASDTVALIDITPTSDEYGTRHPISWTAEMGPGSKGRYICTNWLMARPLFLRPLTPGNTYAALVMDGLKDSSEGRPIIASDDFLSMLEDTAPNGTTANEAWSKYKPLRDYLNDSSVEVPIEKERVIGATVFTVGDTGQRIRSIRQAVNLGPGPEPREVSLCESNSPSSCDLPSGLSGCLGTGFGYDELHGTLDLPRLRPGDSNFLYPELGGSVGLNPSIQGMEDVCFALSVPNALEMPAEGWPLVIYGHGVLGDRSSCYQDGTVDALANIPGDWGSVGAAVLSVDHLFHGSRTIEGPYGPEFTMQHLGNPATIAGNVLQGVAEYYQLERMASALNWSAEESPTGSAIKFDLSKIYFYGHSISARAAIVASGQSLLTKGLVLGGVGGGLPLSLFERTTPFQLGDIFGLYFGDVSPTGVSKVNATNPIISLLQHAAGPADPISSAEALIFNPPELTPQKHVLLLQGVEDTFEGDDSIKSLASAMRLSQVEPFEEKIDGVNSAAAPLRANLAVEMTGAVSDHVPSGYDGHFILSIHPDARRQAVQFIGSAIADEKGIPTVVP